MSAHFGRYGSIYGLLVVVAVTTAAVALSAQGWRSRIPTFDLLTYIRSVNDLLSSGVLPDRGDVGSYGSFSPPGTAWLMVPSTLLFGDPRLSEYASTALLHGATLLGLFLLGRKFFGVWCGCLAVVLYGLSASGLFQAGSLWPIGRPDFFLWTVYLACEWVTRRDARFFAGALGVLGVGMYVDMALAPLLFLFPVLWLVYRPSIRLKPLAVAAALLLVVWYPYLRFEAPRQFADVRSQLLLYPIFPTDLRRTWCDPTLTLRTLDTTSDAVASDAGLANARSLFTRAHDELDDRLMANFPSTRIPGARLVFLLMALFSLLVFGAPVARGEPQGSEPRRGERWLVPAAVTVVLSALVLRFLIAPFVDVQGALPFFPVSAAETLGKIFVAFASVLLLARAGAQIVRRWVARRRVEGWPEAQRTQPVVLGLAVPWLILAAVSEPGRPERFLWLWPLQVLFLAAFATVLLPRLGVPRVATWSVQAVLVFALVGNSFLESRVRDWAADRWSGPDAAEVEVVDYVAARLAAEGRDRAAIGYRLFIYPFMANYNAIDRRYKAGADFDLLFEYRRGITNTNACPEGQAPVDEYRIVQTVPQKAAEAPRSYFDVRLDARFRLLREIGPYQVFARGA
jgi:4-amino-4-deoxy-L-arabinose transferase-like glycosyltransferase